MPYIRKDKCVYKKSGKRKGCSKSVKGAKAFMRALYVNEKLTFNDLIQCIDNYIR